MFFLVYIEPVWLTPYWLGKAFTKPPQCWGRFGNVSNHAYNGVSELSIDLIAENGKDEVAQIIRTTYSLASMTLKVENNQFWPHVTSSEGSANFGTCDDGSREFAEFVQGFKTGPLFIENEATAALAVPRLADLFPTK